MNNHEGLETTTHKKVNNLKIIAAEKVLRDDVWGFNITVRGGTIFFPLNQVPQDDPTHYQLKETLTGDGPIKQASYIFLPTKKR